VICKQRRALLVADASIMPATASAPTNLTTVMIAERIAGWLGRLSQAPRHTHSTIRAA
jgi:choline dehydrogenase-like flavoprotein